MKEAQPLLYSDFALLEEEKLIKAATHRLKYGIVISLAITLFFVVAGYLYISLFLPAAYQMALTYFFILALALPSILIGITLQVMLEVNFRYRELTILATVPSLIKIALIIGLGLSFGVLGICWGIAIAAWVRFAFYYLITLKRETVKQYLNRFLIREGASKEF
jgi:Na+-driven multidrug efflux pump